ncbi:hypothetical protein FOYG_00714 [Fusarium oxysporum NRRL 32931]|uniref:Uncharacterized protein n=1 Tax=Fusarium oxysporum NRRL 32931 TaxID=660029 RepID=W9J205_FUSOX|nr:hypothetical protein FOYG_00714 [Fusarium oxysporum NRRL 32931]
MTDNSDKTSVQLWPWQKRALENGRCRTALPLVVRKRHETSHTSEKQRGVLGRYQQFPGRTLQGVKQTYRKRRFATERQMEKEAFAATSAEPSLIDDDDEKSNK